MARKKTDREKIKSFSASLYPSEIERLELIAEQHRWTPAFLGGELMRIGLAIVQATGKVEVPTEYVLTKDDGTAQKLPTLQEPFTLSHPLSDKQRR